MFWFSPVHQISDSDFSLLLSQSLIEHGTFKLDRYFPDPPAPIAHPDYVEIVKYQLELVNGHTYYFFPPGTSVLSAPFVALLKPFGIQPRNNSGTYGEMTIQTSLAALLMAFLAFVFFITARLITLDRIWSTVIAMGGVLGSQVWSTASRGLWSHTWELLLIGLVVFLIVEAEETRTQPRSVLLATLLAWAYFVRPTAGIVIAVVTILLMLYYRRSLVSYLLTLSMWFVGFVLYSQYNFGKPLPSYYAASRLDFRVFGDALAGNLISPSRGLLIYSPWILFTAYLLIRYGRNLNNQRLLWLSLAVLLGQLAVVSAFPFWWGGVSYGPRLTTDLVPWLVLLNIIGVRAMLKSRGQQTSSQFAFKAELVAGALLLVFSIGVHAGGAISDSTVRWNDYPKDDVGMRAKIWDWHQAQFLAGLVPPMHPREYPRIDGEMIDLGASAADRFLWLGWGRPENHFRWTDGNESFIVFGDERADRTLVIDCAPFIVPGRVDSQTVQIELNGQALQTVTLDKQEYQRLVLRLPAAAMKPQNILVLRLPYATSPASLRLSIDQRRLGLAVRSIEFQKG